MGDRVPGLVGKSATRLGGGVGKDGVAAGRTGVETFLTDSEGSGTINAASRSSTGSSVSKQGEADAEAGASRVADELANGEIA